VTDIGALRFRVTLENPVETPDGAGGVTRSHAPAATVWAAFRPRSGSETVDAGRRTLALTHEVVLRSHPALGARTELVRGTRRFRILGRDDPDGTGRWVRLEVEELAAT
jgi:SPP1 family predicted phage head-tail adaptor